MEAAVAARLFTLRPQVKSYRQGGVVLPVLFGAVTAGLTQVESVVWNAVARKPCFGLSVVGVGPSGAMEDTEFAAAALDKIANRQDGRRVRMGAVRSVPGLFDVLRPMGRFGQSIVGVDDTAAGHDDTTRA